jgi:hypothetical protein
MATKPSGNQSGVLMMLKITVTAAILLGLAAPSASAATKHRRPAAPVNAAVYNAPRWPPGKRRHLAQHRLLAEPVAVPDPTGYVVTARRFRRA